MAKPMGAPAKAGMTRGPTVSSRLLARIATAAAAHGIDGDALCRAAGIAPELVRDVDERIDAEQYFALWGEAMAEVGVPSFPLEVAATGTEVRNLLELVCMNSKDLGEAIGRASRYLRIVTDVVTWSLEVVESTATIRIERVGPRPKEAAFADEFSAAEIVKMARLLTGAPVAPREVWFGHAAPPDVTAHHSFFRAPVRFGRASTELRLEAKLLDLPLVNADPATGAFLEQYVDKMLQPDSSSPPIVGKVRGHIASGLRGELPTVGDVAAALEMSARSLRRHLQAHGTTFQQLLDDTRSALAMQHLSRGRLAVSEIAFLLGFSDASAFHRAFRRWTGTTPQAYAREARASTLPVTPP